MADSSMTDSSVLEVPTQETKPSTVRQEELTTTKWQERLLPLMSSMVVGLTIFFFVASFVQLAYLHWSISHGPEMDLTEILAIVSINPDAPPEEVLAASRLKVLAALDATALERRYHQANILVMSSVWTRYLAFVTGMILALVGSSFILGKLQEPASEMTGKSELAEFSFKSTSPGLILAGLGVVLMLATLILRHETSVSDASVFLSMEDTPSTSIFDTPAPTVEPELFYPDAEHEE